jgi:hypothetical protein
VQRPGGSGKNDRQSWCALTNNYLNLIIIRVAEKLPFLVVWKNIQVEFISIWPWIKDVRAFDFLNQSFSYSYPIDIEIVNSSDAALTIFTKSRKISVIGPLLVVFSIVTTYYRVNNPQANWSVFFEGFNKLSARRLLLCWQRALTGELSV